MRGQSPRPRVTSAADLRAKRRGLTPGWPPTARGRRNARERAAGSAAALLGRPLPGVSPSGVHHQPGSDTNVSRAEVRTAARGAVAWDCPASRDGPGAAMPNASVTPRTVTVQLDVPPAESTRPDHLGVGSAERARPRPRGRLQHGGTVPVSANHHSIVHASRPSRPVGGSGVQAVISRAPGLVLRGHEPQAAPCAGAPPRGERATTPPDRVLEARRRSAPASCTAQRACPRPSEWASRTRPRPTRVHRAFDAHQAARPVEQQSRARLWAVSWPFG